MINNRGAKKTAGEYGINVLELLYLELRIFFFCINYYNHISLIFVCIDSATREQQLVDFGTTLSSSHTS